jgi:hypothetical protein
MNKQFLEIAKLAVEEGWDAFKIMSEMITLQKEIDAKLCELQGSPELAELIRLQ